MENFRKIRQRHSRKIINNNHILLRGNEMIYICGTQQKYPKKKLNQATKRTYLVSVISFGSRFNKISLKAIHFQSGCLGALRISKPHRFPRVEKNPELISLAVFRGLKPEGKNPNLRPHQRTKKGINISKTTPVWDTFELSIRG